jgi:type I site-specific restriction endonuclease
MELPQLNLPPFQPKIRQSDERTEIFDLARKAWVALTPEEWVRQHFLNYLIVEKQVPSGLLAVEKQIKVNRLSKRCDVVVYSHDARPLMIVECKAPGVKISREVYEQAVRYNLSLNIRFMVLTNGLNHHCLQLDYQKNTTTAMAHIPAYAEMEKSPGLSE